MYTSVTSSQNYQFPVSAVDFHLLLAIEEPEPTILPNYGYT
jgi:hypothetical protein